MNILAGSKFPVKCASFCLLLLIAANIADASVEVLQAPPHDLFNLPQKSIGELLLYNPKAGPFVPVKVSGQIIHAGAREYFLSDGSNGLLVRTRNSTPFAAAI